ncbi:WhiB family transcriptional regulator [Nonomuraea sp. NPDC005983]|uniref:WhiB family transcriptional regulator n=1 Tax=Nonomuraea sp. NPDC005983 TaxID=3155595 RepID=UPI0033A0681F
MTYRSTRANAHPAHLTFEQLRAAWRVQGETPLAECVYDPELHVGPSGTIEAAEERAAREDVARDVCAACPALLYCGWYAMETHPTSGVWAGRTPADVDDLDELEAA